MNKFFIFSLILILGVSFVSSQTCETFAGSPSICAPYVSSVFIFNTNQAALSALATSLLAGTEFLPTTTCGPLLQELICKQVFRACYSPPGLPAVVLPKTPCKSICTRVGGQCGQFMLMGQQLPPDCNGLDPTGAPLYVDTFSTVSGLQVPCDASTLADLPAPFSCVPWNGATAECKDLVASSIFTTDTFTPDVQESKLSILAFLTALPDQCKGVFTDLLCKSVLSECAQFTISELPVPFIFRTPPCRESCEIVQEQCAQVFALGGQRPPNCTTSTNGLDDYPEVGYKFLLPDKPGSSLDIPCAPATIEPPEVPVFGCQSFPGTPNECTKWIPEGTQVFVSASFTMENQIETATSTLAAFAAIPDSCRIPLTEYTCKSIFQQCETLDDPILGPVPFKFGRPPCKSDCELVGEQCAQIFAFGGQRPPNCTAPHPGFAGQDLNPETALVFNFFGEEFEVPCVEEEETDQPATFGCKTYKGEVPECNKYVEEGTSVWVSSSFPYSQMVSTAKETLAQFAAIPDTCRLPLTEYTCLNIFQKCEKISSSVLGDVPFFFPRPACQSVCLNVEEQCAQAFAFGGQRPPDCDAPHPGFTGQLLTPVRGFEFTFFGKTFDIPCIPPIETHLQKTFDCQRYKGEVRECNQFISEGTMVWVTPQFDMDMMIGNASAAVSQFAAIPDSCRLPLTEFTCRSIFGECKKFEDNNLGDVAFKFGRPACKSTCLNVGEQCAQIFSFGGQTAPDCNAPHPGFTGQKLYPEEGFKFDFFGDEYKVPCVEPEETRQPPSFSCESFRGKPTVCAEFVDYDVWVASTFTQDMQIELATTNTAALTEQVPPSCRSAALEFLCRSIFQRCKKVDEDFLPVPFYYGQPPCKSLCNQFNGQCAQLFGFSGAVSTDCDQVNVNLNNENFPERHQTFSYDRNEIKVPCQTTSLDDLSPVFTCERWRGEPRKCRPYVGDSIYVFELFDQDTMTTLTETFLDILGELPSSCRRYSEELICKTIFQTCVTLDDNKLPVPYHIGTPPCKEVCQNVRQECADDLREIGIPAPDCEELDPLTTKERYPERKLGLTFNEKLFNIPCSEPHNDRDHHNDNDNDKNHNDNNNNNNDNDNDNDKDKNNRVKRDLSATTITAEQVEGEVQEDPEDVKEKRRRLIQAARNKFPSHVDEILRNVESMVRNIIKTYPN